MTTLTFTDLYGNTASLTDSEVLTNRINGVESSAPLNTYEVKVTRRDGTKVTATDYDKRPITAEGTVSSASPAALQTKLTTLKSIVNGEGYLDVTFDGGSIQRYTVTVKNWLLTNDAYTVSYIPFAINFETNDSPFGSDLTSTSLYSGTASADVVQTSALSGSAEPGVTAQATISTVGSLTGIEFLNKTTNTSLLAQPTFGVNDTLLIDTASKSCTLNGLPVNFTGLVPTFRAGNNDWRLNFLTSSITIDTQQTLYNSDEFIYGTTYFAQSFQASGAIKCHRVDVMLARLGNPSSAQLTIYTDSTGAPGSAITGATATVTGSSITTTPGYVSFYLQNVTSIAATTTYWIVVQAAGATNDINNGFYMKVSNQNPYATYGLSRTANSGSAWATVSNTDAVFRVWKTPVLASAADTSEEVYTENFTTTTNEDSGTTTASWDTTNDRLILPTTGGNSGAKYPSVATGADKSPWVNATNAFATDGVFATDTTAGATDGITYQNFNFGLPSGAVVTGLEFTITGKVSAGTHNISIIPYLYGNITRLSQALSSTDPKSVTLTTTNTSTTIGGPGDLYNQAWSYTEFANGSGNGYFAVTVDTDNSSGVIFSLDSITVKVYYGTYTTTSNVGQTLTLNAANAALMASARIQSAETDPTGTSISYQVQPDAGTGFGGVTNNVTSIITPAALGTTPAHKWKATLSGTSTASPYTSNVALYYRGAMPIGATTDRLAQSFASGAGGSVSGVQLNIVKTAASALNYTIEIQTDSAGIPSGTVVTNGSTTIAAASVPDQASGGDFTWITATFATPPSLTASTTYWVVIKIASSDATKLLVRARGGDSYSSGTAKYSTNSGTAYTTMTNQDFLFQVLSSGSTFVANVTVGYKARSL